MKNRYYHLFFLASSLLLSACKKGSDATPQSAPAPLVNIWKVSDSYYTFNNKTVTIYNRTGDKLENVGDLSNLRWEFKVDGTFVLVQDTSRQGGRWSLLTNNTTLELTDDKTLQKDSYTVDQLDNTHLNMTMFIDGQKLSKGDIAYLNGKYVVDASKGYNIIYKMTH